MSPDAVGAIVGFLRKEWGEDGYRFASITPAGGGAFAEVVHFDGARFYLVADRWGNVREAPSADVGEAFAFLRREVAAAFARLDERNER